MLHLQVRASSGSDTGELEYEQDHGLEILRAQVSSLFDGEADDGEPRLLDSLGRPLEDEEDVEDAISADRRALHVYCVASLGVCTRVLSAENQPLLQPVYKVIDTGIRLCEHCAALCSDPSMLVCEPHALTTFRCDAGKAAEIGLVPPPDDAPSAVVAAATTVDTETTATDKQNHPTSLYVRRQILEAAVSMQASGSAAANVSCATVPLSSALTQQQEQAKRQFSQRLRGAQATALAHEETAQQQAALQAVDFKCVHREALLWQEHCRSEGREPADDAVFLAGLLAWFKRHFFTWCNKPLCQYEDCPAATPGTGLPGKCQDDMSPDEADPHQPTPEELEGGAGRVEVYKCCHCHRSTRFARYNKPSRLLRTRTGRCGEWANCFGLICRAVGLDSRYVMDFTDHVWVEVWLASEGRYCHCDPCENALDAPLTYEHGWGKKLTYVLSVSRHGVVDTTAKYTRQLAAVVERRSALGAGVPEAWLRMELAVADGQLRDRWKMRSASTPDGHLRGAAPAATGVFLVNDTTEEAQLSSAMLALSQGLHGMRVWAGRAAALADAASESRRRSLKRELLALSLRAGTGQWKLAEMAGRISGDEAWKRARGEVQT